MPDRLAELIALLATLPCFDKGDKRLLAFAPGSQDPADYAGTTCESTIRAIGGIQKKEACKTVGKEIRIPVRRKLERLLVH